MAYDEGLAQRIRELRGADLNEKKCLADWRLWTAATWPSVSQVMC